MYVSAIAHEGGPLIVQNIEEGPEGGDEQSANLSGAAATSLIELSQSKGDQVEGAEEADDTTTTTIVLPGSEDDGDAQQYIIVTTDETGEQEYSQLVEQAAAAEVEEAVEES